jgi:hypothetical protein
MQFPLALSFTAPITIQALVERQEAIEHEAAYEEFHVRYHETAATATTHFESCPDWCDTCTTFVAALTMLDTEYEYRFA